MIVRETASPAIVFNANPIIGYRNLITLTNISASNEQTDFPATNLANPATHLFWREEPNSPVVDYYFYFSGPNIDYVALADHNFGSTGSRITLEYSDGSSPVVWNELVQTTPTDDLPLILQLTSRSGDFRIKMEPPTISIGELRQVAVIYAGTILTLERSIRIDVNHTPINLGRNTTVINGFSESGNFLGRILRNQANESKADFQHFTNAWYRTNFDPFILYAQTHPFFWAWDPSGAPTDTGFAWLTKPAIPELNPITSRFGITLEMRGIA